MRVFLLAIFMQVSFFSFCQTICPCEKFHSETKRISYLCDQFESVNYHRAWDFNGVLIFEQEDSLGSATSTTVVDFYENGQLKSARTSRATDGNGMDYDSEKVWSSDGKLIRSEVLKNGVPDTVIEVTYNEQDEKQEVIQCQPVPEEYRQIDTSTNSVTQSSPDEEKGTKLLVFSKEELKVQAKLLKIYLKEQKQQQKNQK